MERKIYGKKGFKIEGCMIRINQVHVPFKSRPPPQRHPEGKTGSFVGRGKGKEEKKIRSFKFITQDLIFQDEKKKGQLLSGYGWSLQNKCRAV